MKIKLRAILKSIWNRFHDVLLAIIIAASLNGIYWALEFLESESWRPAGANQWYKNLGIDIDPSIPAPVVHCLRTIQNWAIALTMLTAPVAAVFAATNDRLALPIRLLAASMNGNRFVYAFCYTFFYNICGLKSKALKITCSQRVSDWLYVPIKYKILYASQYCQAVISISRFMALAFDGLYFRYTHRLPFLQLLLPYIIHFGIAILTDKYLRLYGFLGSEWNSEVYDVSEGWDYETLLPIAFFALCGLDFVTNRNLKIRQQDGVASRAEVLLMWEMIASAIAYLMKTIVSSFIGIIGKIFFGFGILLIWQTFRDLVEIFSFTLLLSFFGVLFFRKRKEKKEFVPESSNNMTARRRRSTKNSMTSSISN